MPFEINGEIKIVLESDKCSFVNELGDKRIPKPWRNENETMRCEFEIVLDIPDYSEVDKLETASIPSWGAYNSLLYAITQQMTIPLFTLHYVRVKTSINSSLEMARRR